MDGKATLGPTWKGMFGSSVALADGTSVTADENYLRISILEPSAQVVKGFQPNLMPAVYKTQFTDQQVNDLVEYMKTLK